MNHKAHTIEPDRSRANGQTMAAALLGVLIYGALNWEMWSLWAHPSPGDFPRLQTLALLMGFEFLLVHSALFINFMPRKTSILFLLPVYGATALMLNTGAENNLILYLYLGLVITRLRFLFTSRSPAQKSRAIKISIAAFLIYLFAVAIIAFGEEALPMKGLTKAFLETNGYFETLQVGGVLTEQPHLPLIMGIIYFSMMIVFELYLLFIRPPRNQV